MEAEVGARFPPTLDAGARADLAAHWLPGRLLAFEDLERFAPGFEASFGVTWLAATPRAETGRALMAGVATRDRYLGYAASPRGSPLLWLLVAQDRDGESRAALARRLRHLSFHGGEALPGLVQGLVRLPDFSREASTFPSKN